MTANKNQEIERKFLVDNTKWSPKDQGVKITQCYLSKTPTVRIRLAGEQAFVTIKGKSKNISRPEFEYEVPFDDAKDMMNLAISESVEKVRYTEIFDELEWTVDVFSGKNTGLIVAEIELDSEDQEIKLPDWILEEVSFDSRYYNCYLSEHPFESWTVLTDVQEFERASSIVDRVTSLLPINLDLNEILINASKNVQVNRWRGFYSHINALLLNVLLNRLDEFNNHEDVKEKVLDARNIICTIIENFDIDASCINVNKKVIELKPEDILKLMKEEQLYLDSKLLKYIWYRKIFGGKWKLVVVNKSYSSFEVWTKMPIKYWTENMNIIMKNKSDITIIKEEEYPEYNITTKLQVYTQLFNLFLAFGPFYLFDSKNKN